MPWLAAALPYITAGAAVGGAATGIVSAVQTQSAQNDIKEAQASATNAQKKEAARLQELVAAAPEKERQAELDKRRKRVQTLLTSQEELGMANVGTKTLLGG